MANILVYIEFSGQQALPASLEALASSRLLATRLGATLYGILPCSEPPLYGEDDLIAKVSRHGADKVVLLTHPTLEPPAIFDRQSTSLINACRRLAPSLLVFADTTTGRELAQGCAAALGAVHLVHPTFHIQDQAWFARQMSADRSCFTQVDIKEVGRPVVILEGPCIKQAIHQPNDEAEVVVLSASAGPSRIELITQPEQDRLRADDRTLLLAGSLVLPAQLEQLRQAALPLGLRFAETWRCHEARLGSLEDVVGPGTDLPWTNKILLVGAEDDPHTLVSIPTTATLAMVTGSGTTADEALTSSPPPASMVLNDDLPGFCKALAQEASAAPESHDEPPPSLDATKQDAQASFPSNELNPLVVIPALSEMESARPAIELAARFGPPEGLICAPDDHARSAAESCAFNHLTNVWHDLLDDADRRAVIHVLSAAVKRLTPSFLLVQDRESLWGSSVVAALLAHQLGWPFVTGIIDMRGVSAPIDGPQQEADKPRIEVARMHHNEVLWWSVELPAVIAVAHVHPSRRPKPETIHMDHLSFDDLSMSRNDILPLCKSPTQQIDAPAAASDTCPTAADMVLWLKTQGWIHAR